MKKACGWFITLIGGVTVGAMAGLIAGLLLPAEKRAQISKPFADRCGKMLERIPDE